MKRITPCPQCGARYDTSKRSPGDKIRCPKCKTVITITNNAETPAHLTSRPISSSKPTHRSDSIADSAHLAQGEIIGGKYRIEKKLGQGGMGAVYLATNTRLQMRVAIKILLPAIARSRPHFAERFLREAQVAAKIRHSHMIAVLDADHDESRDLFYIIFEYVDGKSLRDILKQIGKFEEEKALDLLLQAAQGIHAAHKIGIIHRDIKPDNIMLTTEGTIKVADMGLAKDIGDEESDLTHAGTLLGTPSYMSPEQARSSKSADVRSDIYSLGATFYTMLTGKPPFPGETSIEILHKLANDPVPDPRSLTPTLSAGTASLCMKMMAKDPSLRYSNLGEVIQAIEAIKQSAKKIDPQPFARPQGSIHSPTLPTPPTSEGLPAPLQTPPSIVVIGGGGGSIPMSIKSGVMTSSASTQYYVKTKKEGKIQGPFSLERLKTLWEAGSFKAEHWVSTDRKTWKQAQTIPEFDFLRELVDEFAIQEEEEVEEKFETEPESEDESSSPSSKFHKAIWITAKGGISEGGFLDRILRFYRFMRDAAWEGILAPLRNPRAVLIPLFFFFLVGAFFRLASGYSLVLMEGYLPNIDKISYEIAIISMIGGMIAVGTFATSVFEITEAIASCESPCVHFLSFRGLLGNMLALFLWIAVYLGPTLALGILGAEPGSFFTWNTPAIVCFVIAMIFAPMAYLMVTLGERGQAIAFRRILHAIRCAKVGYILLALLLLLVFGLIDAGRIWVESALLHPLTTSPGMTIVSELASVAFQSILVVVPAIAAAGLIGVFARHYAYTLPFEVGRNFHARPSLLSHIVSLGLFIAFFILVRGRIEEVAKENLLIAKEMEADRRLNLADARKRISDVRKILRDAKIDMATLLATKKDEMISAHKDEFEKAQKALEKAGIVISYLNSQNITTSLDQIKNVVEKKVEDSLSEIQSKLDEKKNAEALDKIDENREDKKEKGVDTPTKNG